MDMMHSLDLEEGLRLTMFVFDVENNHLFLLIICLVGLERIHPVRMLDSVAGAFQQAETENPADHEKR